MDCSTPSLPVHCQLLEITQTHVHWVADAIQPSHPLSSSSPPWSPRNSHESSPAPQFKSINSSVLSHLYGSTLTSVHGSWKNHGFDYMDLYWQSSLSLSLFFFFGLFFVSLLCLCFLIHSRFVIAFLPRSKCLLMSLLKSPSTVVLEPKKKICHCFHFFPHLVAMKWWDQMSWS